MKMPTIGLTTFICLLIASQAPADLITPPSGYSASLDRRTEGSRTNTCPEEASDPSKETTISISFEDIKLLDKQSCEDVAETTYRKNKVLYANYGEYASVVTYRHITFLPGNEKTDHSGMTLYKLTDVTSVCRKQTEGEMGDAHAAPSAATHSNN